MKKDSLLLSMPEKDLRQMPAHIEMEQHLLGALLTDNKGVDVVVFLQAAEFYEPIHQRIYAEIQRVVFDGRLANPMTLKDVFDKDAALTDIGGGIYLAKLASMASGIFGIRDLASKIKDAALKRQLILFSNDIREAAYTEEKKAGVLLVEEAEAVLYGLVSAGRQEKQAEIIGKTIAEALDKKGAQSGIPSDIPSLDEMLGGFSDSDLVILGARPSMGKTALALTIARNAARHTPVGFFSLEMSAEQLAARLLSMSSGVPAMKIQKGYYLQSPKDSEALVKAQQELNGLQLFVDDTPALSIAAIRSKARRLKRKHSIGMLVVDYLQLVRSAEKYGNKVVETGEVSMGLKAIAKELNIPVLALSQLSRGVEGRDDKRPQLADLRESGSIEQDADQVLLLYREAYYIERKKPNENDTAAMYEWRNKMDNVGDKAEIIVAKNRHGAIGTATATFKRNTTEFK